MPDFRAGDDVVQDKFGRGVIESISDRHVVIRFPGFGLRSFSAPAVFGFMRRCVYGEELISRLRATRAVVALLQGPLESTWVFPEQAIEAIGRDPEWIYAGSLDSDGAITEIERSEPAGGDSKGLADEINHAIPPDWSRAAEGVALDEPLGYICPVCGLQWDRFQGTDACALCYADGVAIYVIPGFTSRDVGPHQPA